MKQQLADTVRNGVYLSSRVLSEQHLWRNSCSDRIIRASNITPFFEYNLFRSAQPAVDIDNSTEIPGSITEDRLHIT